MVTTYCRRMYHQLKLVNSYALIWILATLSVFSCRQTETFLGAVCIEHIAVINPGDSILEDQTVIIDGDRIKWMGPSSEVLLSDENHIIDGTGKFLIPGLWDAHVHFAYIEDLAPRMSDLFLAHGITSVRDIGGNAHFVKKWKDQAAGTPQDAPRVMMAGPLLDGMPNVYDGSGPFNPALSVGLATVADVEHMVDTLLAMDVDLLKAYEMLTPEQFARIAELGREHGLKVTGHVPLSMDVATASNLGLNSMEHMRNLELSCAANAGELLDQRRKFLYDGRRDLGGILRSRIHEAQRQIAVENFSEEQASRVLSTLAENDTWQIPTLALNTASTERPFQQDHFLQSFRYLSDSLELTWQEGVKNYVQQEVSDFRRRYSKWLREMIPRLKNHGITIMAGTDCPIFFLTPGLSLHEELRTLVGAGLTSAEALTAATLAPARYFGMENDLGTIAPGKLADLVLLSANPLEDINNTRAIDAVIRNGKVHTREMLNARLNKLQNTP